MEASGLKAFVAEVLLCGWDRAPILVDITRQTHSGKKEKSEGRYRIRKIDFLPYPLMSRERK